MSLTPRLSGKVAARAHHSPVTAAFLHRLAPFFATDQVVGGPLLVATIVALICTNSSLVQVYEAFWDNDLAISLGALHTTHPLADWVNDALLPLFFLIIGAEVKREITKGALSTIRTAAFPLAGAIGGIVVPIAVYLAFTYGTEAAHGWGTVITSDTAFALAIIGLFATRLPKSVRAVLLAFAAIDDVGGLLVIAVAYTDALDLTALIVAIVAYAAMFGALKLRLVSPIPYVLLGLIVWGGTYVSGIHATIAGVMLGLLSPTRSRLSEHRFAHRVQEPIDRFQAAVRDAQQADDDHTDAEEAERRTQKQLGYLQEMTQATDEPAERLVQMLNPWVSYVVLPLFALSAVRIHLSSDLLADAAGSVLGLGVFAGLAFGKPLGFLLGDVACSEVAAGGTPRCGVVADGARDRSAVGHRVHDFAVHRQPRLSGCATYRNGVPCRPYCVGRVSRVRVCRPTVGVGLGWQATWPRLTASAPLRRARRHRRACVGVSPT